MKRKTEWTRTEIVALIGNTFTQAEIKDARKRLSLRNENYIIWNMLNDAELGDYLDTDISSFLA
jgi:hypothetical protein